VAPAIQIASKHYGTIGGPFGGGAVLPGGINSRGGGVLGGGGSFLEIPVVTTTIVVGGRPPCGNWGIPVLVMIGMEGITVCGGCLLAIIKLARS